jgi:hypothetical protein
MNRRRFLQASGATVGLAFHYRSPAWSQQLISQPPTPRALLLHIDKRLENSGQAFDDRIHSAIGASPLLTALSEGKPIHHLDASLPEAKTMAQLAYNHVVLIGLADDPIVRLAWQNEAAISPGSLYAFGFGDLRGSLGYIESDRNPFLHAVDVPKAPFECQIITVTGTDTNGVALALDAFVAKGLVNGIVARNGEWIRASSTLLDRDPLPPSFNLPAVVPAALGSLQRIALTQASEAEYRGVLGDSGLMPLSIWRAKYYAHGQWDDVGEISAFHNYAVGLHRRAYGNTLWAAGFASNAEASAAASLIARAARLPRSSSRWLGNLPPYAWGTKELGDAPHTGTLELWVDGASVLMASRTAPV